MTDLIDRRKIKARFEPWLKVQGYSEGELNMLKAVLYEITVMPSAERHGHWVLCEDQNQDDVDNGNYLYVCSNCNYSDVHAKTVDVPFCWHCGARMDGEHDG